MLGRAVLTLGLLAMSPCLAAEWRERWEAYSHAAQSITGDMTVTARRIVFANGQSLPIRRLRSIPFTDDEGRTVPATI